MDNPRYPAEVETMPVTNWLQFCAGGVLRVRPCERLAQPSARSRFGPDPAILLAR